jgi:nucleoside-diphosphate-sugar epimerase
MIGDKSTMSKKVLFTGVTGFLGSNIARELVNNGFKIYGLHRNSSSFERIKDIFDSITWINTEKNDWINELQKEEFDILIHSAWEGISAADRDDWTMQLKNFEFSKEIFNAAIKCNVSRIISLGSQAEYGIYNTKVSEDYAPMPYDAYGAVKLLTLYYLQNLVKKKNIEWYWIRVFSVFGRGENENWLIPKVIQKLQNNETIELTEGKQMYDYLHIDDFVKYTMKVLASSSDKSGVYNLCSGTGIEIKNLLYIIAAFFPEAYGILDFGKIPYRNNQNMFMVGANDKFESAFGEIRAADLKSSLEKTINYYLRQLK